MLAMKLLKYTVIVAGMSAVSILVSIITLSLLMEILSARISLETIVFFGGCVGIVVSVLISCFLAWLFHLQDADFVGALVPLRDFQRQVNSLDLKIPDSAKTLDTLRAIRGEVEAYAEATDRLKTTVGAINRHFGTLSDEEILAIRKVISSQLEGLTLEFTNNGFTVLWNSLPYHQYFDKMDNDDKVAYFNAIHTGNWQPLRRRSKDKWRV